jgi:hypothetical protein
MDFSNGKATFEPQHLFAFSFIEEIIQRQPAPTVDSVSQQTIDLARMRIISNIPSLLI